MNQFQLIFTLVSYTFKGQEPFEFGSIWFLPCILNAKHNAKNLLGSQLYLLNNEMA